MAAISWEVAAEFSIEDLASSVLLQIAENSAKVGEAAEEAAGALKALGESTFGGVTTALQAVRAELGEVAQAAHGMGAATAAAATEAGAGLVAMAGQVKAVGQAYTEALAQLDSLRAAAAQPMPVPGTAYGPGESATTPQSFRATPGTAQGYVDRALAPYYFQGDTLPPEYVPSEPYRIRGPNIIDGEADSGFMLGSAAGGYALGYDGGPGTALATTSRIGYGTGDRQYGPYAGNMGRGPLPGQGGFYNWHADPEGGPAIPLGDRTYFGSRPGTVPPIPPVPPYGGGGGAAGGAAAGAAANGGFHFGLAELAADYGLFELFAKPAKEENSLRLAMEALNIRPTDVAGRENPAFAGEMEELRRAVAQAGEGTIFDEEKSARALPGIAGVLGLDGATGLDTLKKLYPTALRLGELSELRGKGDLGHEAVAAIELGHMLDQYDPAGLESDMDLVNAVAKRTDSSIARQQSIMKYGLPAAISAGIDPREAIETMAFGEQRLGATSTAGTGYAQFLLGALNTGGGINAHLTRARTDAERQFRASLTLEGDEGAYARHRDQMQGNAHQEALQRLGITDAHEKLLDVTAAGGLDEAKLKQQIYGYAQSHRHEDVVETLKNAFGDRGMRFAEAYTSADAMRREGLLRGAIETAPSVRSEQNDLTRGAMQSLERAGADMSDVAIQLGRSGLALLHGVATLASDVLEPTNSFLQDHPAVAGAGALAVTGGVGYLNYRGAAFVGRQIGRAYQAVAGSGSAVKASEIVEAGAAPEEVAVGAGALSAAGAAGLAVPAAVAAGSIAAGAGLSYGAHVVDANVPALRRLDDWTERQLSPAKHAIENALGGLFGSSPVAPTTVASAPRPVTATAQPGQAPATVTNQVHVTVGPVTFNGVASDIESMGSAMLHGVAEALGRALSHNTGATGGVHLDPTAITAHG